MEVVLVIGLISLFGTMLLRLLTVLENMYSNKVSITQNLPNLKDCHFGKNEELEHKKEYLYELNTKISKQLKIKEPPIYIQDNDTNNAFAINTGFFTAVTFEYKTFLGLEAKGLGAVLAHELFHIQQRHYLKSVARHFFISAAWMILNIVILMNIVDSLNLPEPSKNEGLYWIGCLMLFFSGVSLVGDHIAVAFDRFISRRQEIECDIFAAEATSFGDYLIEAHYFKEFEDFWAKPLVGLSAIKNQVFTTHPNWNKRIVAVASVDKNRK